MLANSFKKLLWRLRHPWLPASIQGRVQPLRFSVCTEAQIPVCMELLARNEAHGVPPGERAHYREALQGNHILTFVAESSSGIVGTFGLQYGYQPDVIWICYVLVSPEQHRHGIGTTLLLASLALLPDPHPPLSIAVAALPKALPFYERLGFLPCGEIPGSNGEKHPLAVLSPVTNLMTQECRKILNRAGATLPDIPITIPTALLSVMSQEASIKSHF